MATHSSTLAWKLLWTEEPGRLQSMGSRRLGHYWATSLSLFTFHFHALEKEMATHSSVLAWRIPGTGEPGGLPSMGLHRVGHDWRDLAAAAASPAKGGGCLEGSNPLPDSPLSSLQQERERKRQKNWGEPSGEDSWAAQGGTCGKEKGILATLFRCLDVAHRCPGRRLLSGLWHTAVWDVHQQQKKLA